MGLDLKPQKSTKRGEKPYFAALRAKNGRSRDHAKPFFRQFQKGLLGNSVHREVYRKWTFLVRAEPCSVDVGIDEF